MKFVNNTERLTYRYWVAFNKGVASGAGWAGAQRYVVDGFAVGSNAAGTLAGVSAVRPHACPGR